MKLHVTFAQQNPEFDKDYAKQYHGGQESDGNRKLNWSRSPVYNKEIRELNVIDPGQYSFGIKNPDGSLSTYTISNVMMLEVVTEDGQKGFIAGASKKLITKTHSPHNARYNTTRFYFYLKPTEEYVVLENAVYIAVEDMPQELLIKNEARSTHV